MIASVLIVAMSAALFVYWFQYMCRLILCAKTTRDYARELADANNLRFADIEKQLARVGSRDELDGLRNSLQRDYEIIAGLLRHSGDAAVVEDVMLKVNYGVLGARYSLARSFSEQHAARVISEMCQIVNHFANTMGERSFRAAEL